MDSIAIIAFPAIVGPWMSMGSAFQGLRSLITFCNTTDVDEGLLQPSDHLLTARHGYKACRHIVDMSGTTLNEKCVFVARRSSSLRSLLLDTTLYTR